jgi:hypothetical protein
VTLKNPKKIEICLIGVNIWATLEIAHTVFWFLKCFVNDVMKVSIRAPMARNRTFQSKARHKAYTYDDVLQFFSYLKFMRCVQTFQLDNEHSTEGMFICNNEGKPLLRRL